MGQVVDTDTAKEFMRETLEKVAAEELAAICVEVEQKSAWFQKHLGRETLPQMSSATYFSLLRRIFSTRRKANTLLQQFDFNHLRDWTFELLYGASPIRERFQTFVDRLEGFDRTLSFDFASEILHFTDPERYWLWTRWIWDPRVRTGALPLVTQANFDLKGETEGETYLRVGEALAFVHQVGEAAGFQTISRNIFGTDVFLSCVYTVYVYTVLRMRMTQEFNRVVPDLPEFSRRLLGVHNIVTQASTDAGEPETLI